MKWTPDLLGQRRVPPWFGWLTTLLGGYEFARILHFALPIGYVLFFLVHIAQVVRTCRNNFRAMVAGFEIEEIDPAAHKITAGPMAWRLRVLGYVSGQPIADINHPKAWPATWACPPTKNTTWAWK
ncbi:hypothetical protein [Hymenobacter terricola]|uniref:hypothetical protein n=1 Tax=Hymenobacter terricola TaxID=2819236 RepID=UPI001B30A169|nr:hypothetical protein [Hymenobacter terricola]